MADFLITQKLVTGMGGGEGITATTQIDEDNLDPGHKLKQSAINDMFNRGKKWNPTTHEEEDLVTKVDLLTKALTRLVPTLAGLNIQGNRAFIYNSQEGLPQDAKAGDVYIYLNDEQNYPFSVRDSGYWVEGSWTTDDKSAFWVEDTLYYIDNNAWKHDISCTKAQYNYVADLAAITELYKIIGQRIAALAQTVYTKPNGGIPKTDLHSDVQASLNKADSALQSHQSLTNYYNKTNKVPVADVIVQNSPTQKTQADVNSELATAITEVKDMTVEEVENPTNNTITAVLNKYYHILSVVNTLNIKLPVIEYESSDTPAIKGIMFQFRTGDNPNISVSSEHWIPTSPETYLEATETELTYLTVPYTSFTVPIDRPLSEIMLKLDSAIGTTELGFAQINPSDSTQLVWVNTNITEADLLAGIKLSDYVASTDYTGTLYLCCDSGFETADIEYLVSDEHIKYFGEKIFRANTLYEVSAMHNGEGWYIDTNYDDSTPIEVVSGTNATVRDLYLHLNKYYRVDFDVNASANDKFTIHLPQVDASAYVQGIVLYMKVDSTYDDTLTPSIEIVSDSQQGIGTISTYENFIFKKGTAYEINFMFNGDKWIVSYGVVS